MKLYYSDKQAADQVAEDMSRFYRVDIAFDGTIYELTLTEIG